MSCWAETDLVPAISLGDRLAHGDTSIFVELLEILDEAVTIRDSTGAIVYANRAALIHLGLASLDDLVSRSGQSIMDDYLVEDEHGQRLTMDDVPSVRL